MPSHPQTGASAKEQTVGRAVHFPSVVNTEHPLFLQKSPAWHASFEVHIALTPASPEPPPAPALPAEPAAPPAAVVPPSGAPPAPAELPPCPVPNEPPAPGPLAPPLPADAPPAPPAETVLPAGLLPPAPVVALVVATPVVAVPLEVDDAVEA